jgi:HAD superfamily hydrolase (TIGR01509 family)
MRAILWDMDGTIADTGVAHYAAWQRLLTERGKELSQQGFDDTFGMANAQILDLWLGDTVSVEEKRQLASLKESYFREAIDRVTPIPGVLRWLSLGRERGYRQAVASSGEMANIVAILEALGLGNSFESVLSGAFLAKSKPDPTIFLHAAASLGATPDECLVIEDGIVGIEAAKRAGIACLAITTTHPAEKLAAADLVLDDLTQLTEDALDQLFQ